MLVALLLSMWAPLTTGIAVVLSRSTTQVADFIRRSIELVALFVSWWVFRYVERKEGLNPEEKARLERIANLSVSGALICSSLVMLGLVFSRLSGFQPGGNVYPGLVIATLGLAVNLWFSRRYAALNREQHNSIIASQRQLYLAKAMVDLCVIAALAAVAVNPTHPATRYIDLLGSVAVSAYLFWSGVNTGRTALRGASTGDELPSDA